MVILVAGVVDNAAEAGGSGPYNVVPILDLHWVGFHRPCRRRSVEPCMEVCFQPESHEALPAQSSSVRVVVSLAGSSPPPAFSCLPQPLRSASSASIPQRLAIVEVEQVIDPSADQLRVVARGLEDSRPLPQAEAVRDAA